MSHTLDDLIEATSARLKKNWADEADGLTEAYARGARDGIAMSAQILFPAAQGNAELPEAVHEFAKLAYETLVGLAYTIPEAPKVEREWEEPYPTAADFDAFMRERKDDDDDASGTG